MMGRYRVAPNRHGNPYHQFTQQQEPQAQARHELDAEEVHESRGHREKRQQQPVGHVGKLLLGKSGRTRRRYRGDEDVVQGQHPAGDESQVRVPASANIAVHRSGQRKITHHHGVGKAGEQHRHARQQVGQGNRSARALEQQSKYDGRRNRDHVVEPKRCQLPNVHGAVELLRVAVLAQVDARAGRARIGRAGIRRSSGGMGFMHVACIPRLRRRLQEA